MKDSLIVFYDGECGFCNRTVDLILKKEKDHHLYFASLQSDFRRDFFNTHGFPEPRMDTLYYLDGSQLLERSDAALAISRHLKSPYSALSIFKWVPKVVRDAVYNFIARNRMKFGSYSCNILSKDQQKRFLDI